LETVELSIFRERAISCIVVFFIIYPSKQVNISFFYIFTIDCIFFVFKLNIMTDSFFDIKGKVAIITGASGALASSVAKSLALSKVNVVLLTRNTDSITSLVDDIVETGGNVLALQADILNEKSLLLAKDKIIGHYGKIDILLNIAGGNLPGATVAPGQTVFDISKIGRAHV